MGVELAGDGVTRRPPVLNGSRNFNSQNWMYRRQGVRTKASHWKVLSRPVGKVKSLSPNHRVVIALYSPRSHRNRTALALWRKTPKACP